MPGGERYWEQHVSSSGSHQWSPWAPLGLLLRNRTSIQPTLLFLETTTPKIWLRTVCSHVEESYFLKLQAQDSLEHNGERNKLKTGQKNLKKMSQASYCSFSLELCINTDIYNLLLQSLCQYIQCCSSEDTKFFIKGRHCIDWTSLISLRVLWL